MAEPHWFEVRLVVRATQEMLDRARAFLDDSGMAEVNRCDVVELDDDLRRWDGGRPPGVVVDPTMDLLRQGHELHEIPNPADRSLHLLERE